MQHRRADSKAEEAAKSVAKDMVGIPLNLRQKGGAKPGKYACKRKPDRILPLPRMREGRGAHRCAWPCSMSQTSQYYNDHATIFFDAPVRVDMGPLHA